MKKNFAYINILMIGTVLLAMLFQSFHIYEHVWDEDFTSEITHNNHKTHWHSGEDSHDKCTICDFTFSPYIATEVLQLSFVKPTVATQYLSNYQYTAKHFCGSLFAHRGPPFEANC